MAEDEQNLEAPETQPVPNGNSGGGGIVGKGIDAAKEARQKAQKAVQDWVKKLASKAFWAALSPYIVPILITIGVIIVVVLGIVIISRAYKGGFGKSSGIYVSASDSSDMASIQEVLGNSLTLPMPTTWYFSQGDPRWGDHKGQAPGWNTDNYKSTGCAITSASMIAKYYGASDITPLDLGQYMADKNHNMALNLGTWIAFIKDKTGKSKKMISVTKTPEAIRAEIAAGNPILAQGFGAFRAGGQHWVVIIGTSKDNLNLVLNDPSADPSRGRAARYSPMIELGSKNIALFALHDQ